MINSIVRYKIVLIKDIARLFLQNDASSILGKKYCALHIRMNDENTG